MPPEPDGKGDIVGPSDIEPNGVSGLKPEVCVNTTDGSYIQISKSDRHRDLFQGSVGVELASTVSRIKQYESNVCDDNDRYIINMDWDDGLYRKQRVQRLYP